MCPERNRSPTAMVFGALPMIAMRHVEAGKTNFTVRD